MHFVFTDVLGPPEIAKVELFSHAYPFANAIFHLYRWDLIVALSFFIDTVQVLTKV